MNLIDENRNTHEDNRKIASSSLKPSGATSLWDFKS